MEICKGNLVLQKYSKQINEPTFCGYWNLIVWLRGQRRSLPAILSFSLILVSFVKPVIEAFFCVILFENSVQIIHERGTLIIDSYGNVGKIDAIGAYIVGI